jgi:hypothetical protein
MLQLFSVIKNKKTEKQMKQMNSVIIQKTVNFDYKCLLFKPTQNRIIQRKSPSSEII